MCRLPIRLDGGACENIRLAVGGLVVVEIFDGAQQGKLVVAAECGNIGLAVDIAVLSGEVVVYGVEGALGFLQFGGFVAVFVGLNVDDGQKGGAYGTQPFDAVGAITFDVLWRELVVFAEVDFAVLYSIGVVLMPRASVCSGGSCASVISGSGLAENSAESFWIALRNSVYKSWSFGAMQAVSFSLPYILRWRTMSPSIMSGWSMKYWLTKIPSERVILDSTHVGSSPSRGWPSFLKNRMSVVTSVVESAVKALLGNRIAPMRSARSAKYLRALVSIGLCWF